MTATTAAPDLDRDAATGPSEKKSRSALESRAKLLIQPILVALILVGYVIWHATAKFDTIEGRALAWGQILQLTWQHVRISVVATVIVLVVAIPLGVLLTRRSTRKLTPFVVGLANIGQAAPSVGLIVIMALIFGIGFWPLILALCLYGALPALGNTIVGLNQVDQRLVEAGRGMGMSAFATLIRVELPLAVPVIIAGARLSLVLLVGTAALAGIVGAGGLGDLITTGIKLSRFPVLISGALLVAALALLIDWLGRVVEEIARPKGI